jgi:hypothetical protein
VRATYSVGYVEEERTTIDVPDEHLGRHSTIETIYRRHPSQLQRTLIYYFEHVLKLHNAALSGDHSRSRLECVEKLFNGLGTIRTRSKNTSQSKFVSVLYQNRQCYNESKKMKCGLAGNGIYG